MRVLGDYIKIKHGFAFKGTGISTEDNGVVLVTPGNFAIGGGFKEDKCKFFIEEYPEEYCLSTDDLIVTMTDLSKEMDTLGYSALVPESKRIYLHNQRIGLVEMIRDDVDKHFIYWFMRTHKYQRTIAGSASGTTVHHTSPGRICEVEVDFPSLKVQKKIAFVLDKIEEKIKLNEGINDNLEHQLHLLFIQIFNGIDMDVILGDVIGTTSGGTPSRKHVEYYESGSICWVKSKELLGSYIYDTEEYINDLAVVKSAAKLLPIHSVLIAMYGATVGAYGIISKPMACNQAVCALLENEKYPYTYLFQIACESRYKFANLAIGSAQQNISQVLIKQLLIHSDVDNIQKFHSLAQPIHKEIEMLQGENRHLSALRDTLLPRLMSGEIDVSDIQC